MTDRIEGTEVVEAAMLTTIGLSRGVNSVILHCLHATYAQAVYLRTRRHSWARLLSSCPNI